MTGTECVTYTWIVKARNYINLKLYSYTLYFIPILRVKENEATWDPGGILNCQSSIIQINLKFYTLYLIPSLRVKENEATWEPGGIFGSLKRTSGSGIVAKAFNRFLSSFCFFVTANWFPRIQHISRVRFKIDLFIYAN